MKILIVSQHFYPEPFRINDMAFSLAQMGHQIHVLTGLPNYPTGIIDSKYKNLKRRNEKIQNVTVFRTPIVSRGSSLLRMGLNYISFAIMGSIKALLIRQDFDLIFVFQTSPVSMILPGIMLKNVKHIPLIVYCLDQWPISVTTGPIKETSLFYKVLFSISQWHYRQADQILLSSSSFKSYFEKILKLDPIRFGLNYLPSYAEDTYGESHYIENDVFDCVFAGNIGPAQSVETIIEAAHLLDQITRIQFHIVGDGLSLKECKKLADHYKLKNIHFYGHHPLEEMKPYYDLADAFLITMVNNPVVNSTLPAKIQSYMRAGKPIIGAISGEVQSVVEQAQCGWIGPALNPEILAEHIIEASNDLTKSRQFGKNALSYYQAHYDKEKILSKLDSYFKEIQDAT